MFPIIRYEEFILCLIDIVLCVLGVQRLQALPGYYGKFTANFLIEILRGGKSKKILQCNWDKDQCYGKLNFLLNSYGITPDLIFVACKKANILPYLN